MTNPRREARRAEIERNDHALLQAARAVLSEDGAHASVDAIATRAGVGVGTLYRRYRTKDELFQRLAALALEDNLRAATEALVIDDPWAALTHYVAQAVQAGTGMLGPIAGTIEVTDEMADLSARSDDAARQVIARARAAGILRADVNAVDILLLIEQLGRSPMLEQITRRGDRGLIDAAEHARSRMIAVVLDGLRTAPEPLPEPQPDWDLFWQRWETD